LLSLCGVAVGATQALPTARESPGLAAKYPGDAGIERDRSVVFAESFEAGNLARWDDADGNPPPKVRLVRDKEHVHAGRVAAQLTVPRGKGVGADLTKWFSPGFEQLYARWYTKLADDYDQGNLHHAGGNLVGMRNRWLLGVAGQKPDGTDRFSTGLETWRDWGRNPAPGELFLYTYYPDMKRDPDGNYWGNSFKPEKKTLLGRGRWHCLEMMVKLNDPARADGEQAFWLDGRLVGHFPGIRWRTVDSLRINGFWLLLYIHDSPQENRLWLDDVVVATDYIGPRQ
jgi:hypothetical protein